MDADSCSTVDGRCNFKRETVKTDDDVPKSGNITLLEANSAFCA